MRLFVILFLAWVGFPAHAQSHHWTEFEIIGQRYVTREQVLPYVPVKIGDEFVPDSAAWKAACDRLKGELKLAEALCSSVRTSNFEAFFIVEVIEKGQEYRLKFRPEPTAFPELTTAEIREIHDRLHERVLKLVLAGTPTTEFWPQGYLDYGDPELHALAVQLAESVPPFRDNLLDVLRNHRDESMRGAAANLLNWAKSNSVLEASRLLDDPSELVRNNISRYSLHFVDKVGDSAARKEIIGHLLRQLDRPSHGDRNKSLFALLFLLKAFPSEIPVAKTLGQDLIGYVARTSRIFNVGPVAGEILELFASHLPRQ